METKHKPLNRRTTIDDPQRLKENRADLRFGIKEPPGQQEVDTLNQQSTDNRAYTKYVQNLHDLADQSDQYDALQTAVAERLADYREVIRFTDNPELCHAVRQLKATPGWSIDRGSDRQDAVLDLTAIQIALKVYINAPALSMGYDPVAESFSAYDTHGQPIVGKTTHNRQDAQRTGGHYCTCCAEFGDLKNLEFKIEDDAGKQSTGYDESQAAKKFKLARLFWMLFILGVPYVVFLLIANVIDSLSLRYLKFKVAGKKIKIKLLNGMYKFFKRASDKTLAIITGTTPPQTDYGDATDEDGFNDEDNGPLEDDADYQAATDETFDKSNKAHIADNWDSTVCVKAATAVLEYLDSRCRKHGDPADPLNKYYEGARLYIEMEKERITHDAMQAALLYSGKAVQKTSDDRRLTEKRLTDSLNRRPHSSARYRGVLNLE